MFSDAAMFVRQHAFFLIQRVCTFCADNKNTSSVYEGMRVGAHAKSYRCMWATGAMEIIKMCEYVFLSDYE